MKVNFRIFQKRARESIDVDNIEMDNIPRRDEWIVLKGLLCVVHKITWYIDQKTVEIEVWEWPPA